MKKTITAIAALLACISAYAVQIGGASKLLCSKTYVKQSICGFEKAPDSRMWMAVEASVDGKSTFVALSYSDNLGKSWSDAVNTVTDKTANISNGTLWCAPDGALWLFFTANAAPTFDGRGALYASRCEHPLYKEPQWSQPVEIGYGFVTDKPVVLPDGTWMLPYSLWGRIMIDSADKDSAFRDLDAERGAGVMISTDKGASWHRTGTVVNPPANAQRRNDASLVALNDGRVKMIVRGSDNVKTCQASEYITADKGASWSDAAKFIDNPDRRISVTKLSDGKLLMVKNGYFDQLCYIRPYNLVCYLSDDEGATWYGEMRIASGCLATRPYALEDEDGNLWIAYDYNSAKTGEICLLSTSQSAIEAVYGQIGHEDVPGRTVSKAGKCASFNAAELKTVFAPRKNWASETLRIGTYNIQYRNPQWTEKRLPALQHLLAKYQFDVFGAQEPFLTQIEDMQKMDFNGQPFGEVYDYVGRVVTNVDGDRGHHYNPIFYRKDRVELIEWGLEWFTDCPGKAGFGAYSSRQCCWGHFRDKKTGKEFFCFNSHPDHLGQEAREKSSEILVDAVRRIAKGMPAFLSGDFNAREETPSYNIIMECGYLDDALLSVYNPVNAEYFSMSHYKPIDTVKKEGKHIDHVFYTPNSSKVLSWELITDSYNDYFGSDHLPIICEWKIAN